MGIDSKGNQVLPDDFEEAVLADDDFDDEDVELEEESDESTGEERRGDVQVDSSTEDKDDVDETDQENTPEKAQDSTPGDGDDEKADEKQDESAANKKFAKTQAEYSRKVQRRINKEVKQREQLRAENAALQQRFNELEARLQTNQTASNKDIVENRLRNATAMKQQMLDEGENERVVQIDNDIMDMKIYLRDLEAQAKTQPNVSPQGYPPQQQQHQQQEVYIPTPQKDWMDKNTRFNKDAGYTAYVNEEYDKLVDEGYDPEDASLYEELDSRIGRKTENKPLGKKRPTPAPSPNTAAPTSGVRSKKGKLTAEDKRNMMNWDLDPNNAEVRKEWLRNKRAS
jgi:hypothetical protein